jgi:chaperonin cofactor prefoldin
MRTYDFSAITGMRFADPALQLQLKEYLGSLVVGRSKEKRSVYIDSTDAKARRVSVTYVVPTPVWKSSYRLIFAETGGPTLEGWAIVDNTSGEDWTKVRLALVSGRPVSFISRLYEPRYVQRQVSELPEDQAAAPEIHEGAIAMQIAAPPPPAPKRSLRVDSSSLAAESVMVTSSIVGAQARELGELFEYSFSAPITVRKDESAMLPFLQQQVTARKLLIYSGGDGQNPRNAAEITNSSGKTLDGGPITVYEGNAYAGEALVETVKAGDKRLISYAVDLGTRITTKLDSASQTIREIHVRRGLITTRWAARETTTYTIRNVDQKAKLLIIEHPIRPQYKLLNLKPAETTSAVWRFEVKLAPGASETFPVGEERVYDNSLMLVNAAPDFLASYVQNAVLDEAGRKALARIVEQKRLIAANDAEINRAEQQLNETVRDEERVRQNIASLNVVSGQQDLVQKYARQLEALETQIAGLRDRLAELRKKKAALNDELNAQIERLDF